MPVGTSVSDVAGWPGTKAPIAAVFPAMNSPVDTGESPNSHRLRGGFEENRTLWPPSR